MAPAVHFRSALALIGGFPALAGVDLDVDSGEVLLLQGPNGAGKSSLLRACAGLLAVVEGEAEVLGHDLRKDRRGARRRVAMLGHANSLYDDLTVEENVRFAVRASGARSTSVVPSLERLGLLGRLRDTTASRLSAGQRRRTALSILVARSAELWLLDEPHAGLDVEGRAVVDDAVAEAVAGGATVLIASHELERAGAIATRVVTVAGGQVHEPGAATTATAPAQATHAREAEPAHVA